MPNSPCVHCYNGNTVYPRNCGIDPCKAFKTGTDLTFFNGPNLPCTGINTCDNLTLSLEKIDNAICQLINQMQTCCGTTTSTTTSSTTTAPQPYCRCYYVYGGGPGSPTYPVQYIDCNGMVQNTSAGGGIGASFCALLGSVVTSASFVDNGLCSGPCIPPTTTTTTTI